MCAKTERVGIKNIPFTFVLDRYDGGMVTICTIDFSVRDAAHCLECVDRLSEGRSTTVIHSDTQTEAHAHREVQYKDSNTAALWETKYKTSI